MSFRAVLYAYILGGFTFIPLLLCGLIAFTVYTSVPIEHAESSENLEVTGQEGSETTPDAAPADLVDLPKTRKGWLTVRRTFQESAFDGGYVTLVRSFLDARSKDPKRSRPKDMWYVVLKGKILYLYEDEGMTECEAVIQMGSHDVVVYPEGLLDGELFTKRNAICLKPRVSQDEKFMPSLTKEMKLEEREDKAEELSVGSGLQGREKEKLSEQEKAKALGSEEAIDSELPWFIFVRSTVEMEDWYFALIHASNHTAQTAYLAPLHDVFQPSDMNHLVSTLDEQPDVIPMRWFNALLGRIFYSFYRTHHLEAFIIGRLMKKLSKVKRPALLNDIVVTEVSVGNKTPTFSKPMLKELTKEGDFSMEVHVAYKGEIRITVEATATINLGARFKPYAVKLVLAAVLRELEGNLLVKVKRPPSNRIWYAFTQTPRMVLNVEPIVSDRQITWSMILSTIESRLKEIIQESVVLPNMDDIAFFESLSYQNRGGIYSDATRHLREPSVSNADEAIFESGPPIRETISSDSKNSSNGDAKPELPPVQRTQSLYESSTAPEAPQITSTLTSPEESSSSANRRRTWFSSVRSTDMKTLIEQSAEADELQAQRGRTLDASNDTSTQPTSQSTPLEPEGKKPQIADETAGSSSALVEPPAVKSRSSSRHSSARNVTPASLDEGISGSFTEPSTMTSSSNVDRNLNPSPTPNPPLSPTSFLSTFKSRAADKQALSNTAKEAIKKWGVNWGGLKKNSGANQGQLEEMPDHGSVEGSARSQGHARSESFESTPDVMHKTRASYAEVRAAVAERRNKQASTASGSDDESPSSQRYVPQTDSSSKPMSIPSHNGSLLYPDTNISSRSLPSTSSSTPTSSHTHKSTSQLEQSSISLGAHEVERQSESRASVASAGKAQSNDSAYSLSSEVPAPLPLNGADDAPPPAFSPIHVQPQAKTMSIPGIHASHKGDVMSMGYVAPVPPTERQRKVSSTSQPLSSTSSLGIASLGANSLSKNPKIQSMYRLWKQKTSPQDGQSQGSSTSELNASQDSDTSLDYRTASSTADTPSSSMPTSVAPTIAAPPPSLAFSHRPTPPPLPARPNPVTVSPSRPPPLPSRTSSRVSAGTAMNVQQAVNQLSSDQPSTSAQDALKEIATKDDHTRKRASLSFSADAGSLSASPPSPTRSRRASAGVVPSSPVMPLAAATTANEWVHQSSSSTDIDPSQAWGLEDDELLLDLQSDTSASPSHTLQIQASA